MWERQTAVHEWITMTKPTRLAIIAAVLAVAGSQACSGGSFDNEWRDVEDPDAGDPDDGDAAPPEGGDLDDGDADTSCAADSLDLEGCDCQPSDAPRSCYPGPSAQAGVGACTTGTQACETTEQGEFAVGVWGPCEGAGQPASCEAAGATCGAIPDECGGQLDCGVCPDCSPGSLELTTPGASSFTVPAHVTLTVELWGGGGGGTAYAQIEAPTPGGDSSFGGTVIAGGGGAGDAAVAAPGGTAAGGDVNLPGGAGSAACAAYLDVCAGRVTRIGGSSPNGGDSDGGIIQLDACSAFMFGSGAGDAENGHAPGGGGAGDWTCQYAWTTGAGWGMGGAGGGAGAYASITYSEGELSPGASVQVVVGEGGRGSRGATSSLAGGMGGRNPGYYTGGDGGRGEVRIAWTCE
jgi:hypothetical protein